MVGRCADFTGWVGMGVLVFGDSVVRKGAGWVVAGAGAEPGPERPLRLMRPSPPSLRPSAHTHTSHASHTLHASHASAQGSVRCMGVGGRDVDMVLWPGLGVWIWIWGYGRGWR